MNIIWECLALIDVLGAVAESWQSVDCARLRCNPRTLENLKIAHPSADCAYPVNAPNRRVGHLMKIVCINFSDRTFKIAIAIFTGKIFNYPIVSSTSLNILIIITNNTRFKIMFCCP